jgi:pimeloyl-ACP methyl ester carboxylesterase
MLLKTIKWVLIALLAALLVAALVLDIGARRALDNEGLYTAAAESLPAFEPDMGAGLAGLTVDGQTFRLRVAGFNGDADRPAVMLLHGFPVTSAMWLPLIEPLAAAGFRVVAPDQRGYSPLARPEGAPAYRLDLLSADILAIADALGLDRFHLVGHDWGAISGWYTVMHHPQRFASWTGLSVPHPAAFMEAVQNDPDQRSRSRYVMLFVTPWLPEVLFTRNDLGWLRTLYQDMGAGQRVEYLAAFAEPGALTAALNWYRATAFHPLEEDSMAIPVSTPTLFIWGNRDQAIAASGVAAQQAYLEGPYREVELDAGHWLVNEAADTVLAELLGHLSSYPVEPRQ